MSSMQAMDVQGELRRRIGERGPITFAEFMRVALYWPNGGYYATRTVLGPRGDFYTAPLTHPVFGALVGRQLAQMWRALGSPSPFWVLEPGAGTGTLGRDVARYAASADPAFAVALRHVGVDVRPPALVRSDGMPFRGVRGVVLANELLDAMPVHRVTVAQGALRELYVALGGDGGFEEHAGEPSTPDLARRLDALGVTLSEGYRAEINLGLDAWCADAAGALDAGYVLVIDYGHEADTYYAESRRTGTLRCYAGHTLNAEPYREPGAQDISVHVELTSLRNAAEGAGLAALGSASQAGFLRALGFDAYRADIAGRRDLPAPVRTANLRALDTLVAPDGMGAFRVLAFGVGVEGALDGFADGAPAQASDEPAHSAPLATAEHRPLGGVPEPRMPTWEELVRGGAG